MAVTVKGLKAIGVDTDAIAANYLRVFDRASKDEVIAGSSWYAKANAYAHALASGTTYTVEQTIALVAVISPSSDWSGKNDTIPAKMIAAHAAGHNLCDVGTDGTSNSKWPFRNYDVVRKAQRILDGDLTALSGNKVTAFGANIAGDYTPVTVDGWMVKAGLNEPARTWKDCGLNSKGDGVYVIFANAVTIAASERNTTPAQFQAVVWESYRRQHTIR